VSFGPRIAISFKTLRDGTEPARHPRLHGPCRRCWRQRRHGIFSIALLQKNVLNRQRWNTREGLRIAIITWIERTYHRRRRQQRLGRMTPIEFEAVYTHQRMALAA
jgi:transposase InsO family protein